MEERGQIHLGLTNEMLNSKFPLQIDNKIAKSQSLVPSKEPSPRKPEQTKMFVLKFNDMRASGRIHNKGLSVIGKHINQKSEELLVGQAAGRSMGK